MDKQKRHDTAGAGPSKDNALARLAAHLLASGSDISIDQAMGMAIDAWLAAEAERAHRAAASGRPGQGYQWKELFLPDTTQLRMSFAGRTEYADVVGDAIIHQGRSVSPRALTIAIAGDGRNAWRDLLVRRPGDAAWQRASALRARIERASREPQPRPPTSAESMAAAAACMSDALKSALAVVDHVNAQSAQHERRVERHRRAADFLADECDMD